jgi:sporulation protein YlmC with PRC-barrel domain
MRTYSSLRGRTVETESGRPIGRCFDLRGELGASTLEVTGLVVGGRGRLEHFGLRRGRRPDCVPWAAVVRIEGKRIVVRDGTELE